MTNTDSITSAATAQRSHTLHRLGLFGTWLMITMWVNSWWVRWLHLSLPGRLLVSLVFITMSYVAFEYLLGRYSRLPEGKGPLRLFARAFAFGRGQRDLAQ